MAVCKVSYFQWDWGPLVTVQSPSGNEISFPVKTNKLSIGMEQLIREIQRKSWSMYPIHTMSVETNLMREMLSLEIKTITSKGDSE